jgi:hypothetical protein
MGAVITNNVSEMTRRANLSRLRSMARLIVDNGLKGRKMFISVSAISSYNGTLMDELFPLCKGISSNDGTWIPLTSVTKLDGRFIYNNLQKGNVIAVATETDNVYEFFHYLSTTPLLASV